MSDNIFDRLKKPLHELLKEKKESQSMSEAMRNLAPLSDEARDRIHADAKRIVEQAFKDAEDPSKQINTPACFKKRGK